MNSTTFYIVRHGESEFNKGFVNNNLLSDELHFKTPLTNEGREQIKVVSGILEGVKFAAIFSSDMTRATESAEILAENRELSVDISYFLRERRFTTVLQPIDEIKRKVKNDMSMLNEEEKMAYKYTLSDESAAGSAKRLIDYLSTLTADYAGKTILVVNHGNNMRSLLTYLNWAKYDELPSGSVVNGGYFVLESNGTDFYVKDTYGITKQQEAMRIL